MLLDKIEYFNLVVVCYNKEKFIPEELPQLRMGAIY